MPDVFGVEGGAGAPDPRAKKPGAGKKKVDPGAGEPDMLWGTNEPSAGEGPRGRFVQYDNESGALLLNLPAGAGKYKAELEADLMDEFYGEAAGGVDAHRSIDVWIKDWLERKAKEDPSVLEDDTAG